MKVTTEQIMNMSDIKAGDRIIYHGIEYTVKRTRDIQKYILVDPDGCTLTFGDLIDEEFQLIKPKKKVGETLCCEHFCEECPLRLLSCETVEADTLYEVLDETFINKGFSNAKNPIYLAFKNELDKEVVE